MYQNTGKTFDITEQNPFLDSCVIIGDKDNTGPVLKSVHVYRIHLNDKNIFRYRKFNVFKMAKNLNVRGNKFCFNLLKEEVRFMCEDCNEKACDSCVSSKHKGHNLVGIKQLVREKFKKIHDWNTVIRETRIPKIKKELQAVTINVKKKTDGIRKSIKNAEEHGTYLKKMIDESTAETVNELKDLETKITNKLDSFKSECDDVTKRLEDLMKESKEATKSDNDVLIVDTEEHMASLTIDEPVFECNYTSATFIKGSMDIKEALGTIVYEESHIAPTTDMLKKPVMSKLLDLSYMPMTIQRTRQGTLWILHTNVKELMSLDKHGSTETLSLDNIALSLCVDPADDHLYCTSTMSTEHGISIVDTKTGKTTTLFVTASASRTVNITTDANTFIVGELEKPTVKLYNRRGTVLQIIQTVDKPLNIAVCRSTGRVAIACGEGGIMVMENNEGTLFHMNTYSSGDDNVLGL